MIKQIKKTGLGMAFFMLLPFITNAQIVINEFCASNASIIEDIDYSDYSDWIELYNAGSTALNIKGYYITDNLNSPNKYQITTDAHIQANGYLIIWVDGNSNGLHAGFKLAADGEQIGLYNASQELVDTLSFSVQQPNISYGRINDGSSEWGYFLEPTPKAKNTTTAYTGFASNMPEFSIRGGMYTSTISTELFTDLGGEIRYSTNGSEPNKSSTLYAAPIKIESTTVIRARVFKANLIPGPVITNSYFINENSTNAKLPVVSLATDSDNFWDSENGIFVQDFKPLWDVPINIELFENNGSDRAAFNEPAGTKVNGLWSWQLPQKMLGVYFKKQYGENKLEYPLFSQRKRGSYKSFSLRASGNDWSYTLFRDVLGQHATLYNMNIDIMSFKPASVFLNGEFLCIANIREKVDDDYIEKSYNLEGGTFDLIENEDYVEAGSIDEYNIFHNLLHKNLSTQANFEAVAEQMNIENFTDYIITEMATANTSISHNVMAWKTHGHGKWRWILMDLDRGFFNPTEHLLDFYIGQDEWPLKNLFENDKYVEYFGTRLASQLFTSFYPDRMIQLIDEHKELIEDEIPRHVERWLGTTSNYGDALPSVDYWYNKVDDLKSFVKARPAALLADLRNYGFGGTANLSLATLPEKAGQIYLNDLKVPQGTVSAPYLKDVDFILEAKNIPGYEFIGWSNYSSQVLLPAKSEWKYLDEGTNQGTQWIKPSFNDAGWNTGKAELGYGDGDENTVVSFGTDSNNKFATTYFRKTFNLSADQSKANDYTINLLYDDGAIVYLNGIEVLRANMPTGTIAYQTMADGFVSGDAENIFTSFTIDAGLLTQGENVLAVEVHQGSGSSSDLSFDLELSATYAETEIVSTESVLQLNLAGDKHLIAVFEESGSCIIPFSVSEDMTLHKACSPYMAQGNITVANGAKLIIEPGVEILMPENASITVNGAIVANGTADNEIIFSLNPDYGNYSWGILAFKNTTDTSTLKHVTIKDASMGTDPVFDGAAISAFNAILKLDNLTLTQNYGNPIMARYSDVTLTNSTLHSDITGDLINVKYGKARIENCRFIGNDMPDTDAIDYDEIENGVIRSCEISNFRGFNSDAVDIGEKATLVDIDSLWVFSITDKGVSIGQRSSALIRNSVFVNCNMGVGVKDSSHAIVENSIFYGNGQAIACFEKNLGKAGGNAWVTNSILSNSSANSVFYDAKSTLQINHSLSDMDTLPKNYENINQNPRFGNATFYDFGLQDQSPALGAGIKDNQSINLGTKHPNFNWEPSIMICQIFVNPNNIDYPEFIALYNPNSSELDISNYAITKGVTLSIPEGIIIGAYDTVYLTNNSSSPRWWDQQNEIIQWSEGKLSNNGEGIQLENNYGMVIDYIKYNYDANWPSNAFTDNMVMMLKNAQLDNHFGEHWMVDSVSRIFDASDSGEFGLVSVFPNPSRGELKIQSYGVGGLQVDVRNVTGQLIKVFSLNAMGYGAINLSEYPTGMYFVTVNNKTHKVILVNQ
jgi:hypothetical protein